MKFDLDKEGLETIMYPYEAALVYMFLDETEQAPDFKMGSGDVWRWLQTQVPELRKSRASVIFSLNRRVDQGILTFDDATGKGGHHRVYRLAVDHEGLHDMVVTRVVDCLDYSFGAALKRAIDAEIIRRRMHK